MEAVKAKWAELRSAVGVLAAKKKDGVRFKVRSADELCDRIRPVANRLGLLIYPVRAEGKCILVEDGTLAEVTVTLRIEALEDGSFFDIQGFGLGADSQDKAGGKAGTYAWKAALVQALLAGGEKDTDDTDTPIQGGVRPRAAKSEKPASSRADVEAKIAEAKATGSMDVLRAALAMAGGLTAADQGEVAAIIKAAAADIKAALRPECG